MSNDGLFTAKESAIKPPPMKPVVNGLSSIDEQTLSQLENMPKEALISLIRRVSGAIWGIGLMTEEEAYEAACLKLLHGGLTERDIWKALPSLKEWMDRRKGKPAQSVALTVESKGIDKLSDERLLRLERELAKMTGQEAITIAPEPGKLTNGYTPS